MVIAVTTVFLGSLGVLAFIFSRGVGRVLSAPEAEIYLRRRQPLHLLRWVAKLYKLARRFLDFHTLLRFLELVLRRFRVYVLKFENLLARLINRLRGGSVFQHEKGDVYWKQVRSLKGNNFSPELVATNLGEDEDFLSLNFNHREEAHELPEW